MTRAASTRPIAGVILAGGQSRRMGTDKAELEFRGRRLLDLAGDLLSEAGCDSVYVSGRPGLDNAIPDTTSGQGPAHAMLDCLEALGDRIAGILFLPVDMPLLKPADLAPLLDGDPETARAWADHPLPAYVPAAVSRLARDQVRSVRSFLAALPIDWQPLEPGQAARFANLNTQADLTAARKMR
jgi:molybdopterin-guanine dinucleotide biosynthesis protein A